MLKSGDILVYSIEENGQEYEFLATIRKFGETISYDYTIPQKNEKGTIATPGNSVKSGFHYQNVFNSSAQKSKDKNTLWLSKDNFRGLATKDKQTKMDMGNGTETFIRAATSTQTINYKGKERIITIHKITSQESASLKELWVMNDISNPLITNLNGTATVTLKEVR